MCKRLPLFVTLLIVAAQARAEEPCLRLPLAAAEIPAPRVSWYGIYMNGQKVGWMREEFGKGAMGYFLDQTGRLSMTSMGQTMELELSSREEFDGSAPFAFRGGRSVMKQGEEARIIEVARREGSLSAEVSEGGERRTHEVAALDYTLADLLTPERWVRTRPAAGATARVRTFDFDELKPDSDLLTIAKRRESIVAGVREVWYEATSLSELSGEESTVRVDAEGKLLSIKFAGLFEGRLETEEIAKRTEISADLFVFGLAKLDKPIGEAPAVRRLVLEVDGAAAAKIPAGPRQAIAREDGTGAITLTLGAEAAPPAAATPKEIEDALADTVASPIRLPQVEALAAQAVGDAQTPREKVERLVRFVDKYVDDVLSARELSVVEIIAGKRGDCSEHAALFTALARAAGIPAREVSGLMYMGDDARAFGGHAWNEVVLDGRWIAVDPTWNQIDIDATHITLTRDGKGMAFLATMGRLEFRLRAVERAK